MKLLDMTIKNPVANGNPDTVHASKSSVKFIAEAMSLVDAEEKAVKKAEIKISKDTNNSHYRVVSEYEKAVTKGKFKGGNEVTIVCQVYKFEKPPTVSKLKKSIDEVYEEVNTKGTEIIASAQESVNKVKSQANKIVNSINEATQKFNDLESDVENLIEQAKDLKALKNAINEKKIEITEDFINQQMGKKLSEEIEKITQKYGNIFDDKVIQEKLNAIRAYEYAFINDPELRQKMIDKIKPQVDKAVKESVESVAEKGKQAVDRVLGENGVLLQNIDKFTSPVEQGLVRVEDIINDLDDITAAKLEDKITEHIDISLRVSEEINDSINHLNETLSKYGVTVNFQDTISPEFKKIAQNISKDITKKIMPLVEKGKEKLKNVTKIVNTVKSAIQKAKKMAQEYIDKLKQIANDFIAKQTAIIAGEISKYIKLDFGGFSIGF